MFRTVIQEATGRLCAQACDRLTDEPWRRVVIRTAAHDPWGREGLRLVGPALPLVREER